MQLSGLYRHPSLHSVILYFCQESVTSVRNSGFFSVILYSSSAIRSVHSAIRHFTLEFRISLRISPLDTKNSEQNCRILCVTMFFFFSTHSISFIGPESGVQPLLRP